MLALPVPTGLGPAAWYCAAAVLWMALWWMLEPVHTAVTALLPLVLFPLCGVLKMEAVGAEYGDRLIFLFIAGFFFGKSIEHWGLHRRLALWVVVAIGGRAERLVLGFMLATALISMWVSNTATAVMMAPVAAAVAANSAQQNLQKALLLGVGYACSIGGLGTMIGTPVNAIAIAYLERNLQIRIGFAQWFAVGFPLMLSLVLLCWLLLLRFFPLERQAAPTDALKAQLRALGPLGSPEKRLLWLFGAVVLGWVSGALLWYRWFPACNDTVVALVGAILLFVVPPSGPSRAGPDRPEALLTWPLATTIPWNVVILFGGGLALAKGIEQSGLATWLGGQMQALAVLPTWLLVPVVLLFVVLLSEIASNIATAAMVMPILAALCAGIGLEPQGLLLGATMAASFGFGLPVAAAANSIVYATGYFRSRDMMRVGFLLDLLAVALLSLFVALVFPLVF